MSNYTYHGTSDLIAMPGRSVQTYPSGLVRVERYFMCRKDDAARYRNVLRINEPMPYDDGAPSIDGLFIFPHQQEQVRDDGFVEFRVTAYGRSNTEGVIDLNPTASFAELLFSQILNNVFDVGSLRLITVAGLQFANPSSVPIINENLIIKQAISTSENFSTDATKYEIRSYLTNGNNYNEEDFRGFAVDVLSNYAIFRKGTIIGQQIIDELKSGVIPSGRFIEAKYIENIRTERFGFFREIVFNVSKRVFYANVNLSAVFFQIYNKY
jgi:hypothetical protein